MEILFCGKSVSDGEKIYSSSILNNGTSGRCFLDVGKLIQQWVEIDVNTLGRYTGMKDKHGIKIFERDEVIVNDDYDEKGIISWDSDELEWIIDCETVALKMGCFYPRDLEII